MMMKVIICIIFAFVCAIQSAPTPAPVCREITIFNRLTPTKAATFFGDDSVTLGLKFYSEVPGKVTSVSFYKVAGDNATFHTAVVWDQNGNYVASAYNNSEPASGWVNFKIITNRIVPAYSSWTVGVRVYGKAYTYEHNYFTDPVVDNTPLHGIRGTYKYGHFQVGSEVPVIAPVPDQDYLGTNYWIDVGFTPSTPCPSSLPCGV